LADVPEAVLMVRVLVAGLAPGVTDAGLNEQLAPEGNPEAQLKSTAPLNPLAPLTETV
jgi:hypothetical protein